MAKKQLGLFTWILMAVSAVGLVLAVVGVAVPWFTFTGKSELLGSGAKTESYGLFGIEDAQSDFPLAAVQAFGLLGLIFSAIALAALLLNTFGILKLNYIVKIVIAALTVIFGLLAMIFAIVYANQFGSVDQGALVKLTYTAAAGGYLVFVGGLLAGVPLALKRK